MILASPLARPIKIKLHQFMWDTYSVRLFYMSLTRIRMCALKGAGEYFPLKGGIEEAFWQCSGFINISYGSGSADP